MIYNMYIFSRKGECLFSQEWRRPLQSALSQDEEFKLLYGMLFSLKSFVNRIAPVPCRQGFQSFRTSTYKMNYYESASGLKIVLNTDPSVGNIDDVLFQLYSTIYVEYVVKNPLCSLESSITSELFKMRLNSFITQLPFY